MDYEGLVVRNGSLFFLIPLDVLFLLHGFLCYGIAFRMSHGLSECGLLPGDNDVFTILIQRGHLVSLEKMKL